MTGLVDEPAALVLRAIERRDHEHATRRGAASRSSSTRPASAVSYSSRSSFHRSLSLVPYWKTMSAGSRRRELVLPVLRGPGAASRPPSRRASPARRRRRPAASRSSATPKRRTGPAAHRVQRELRLAVVGTWTEWMRETLASPRVEKRSGGSALHVELDVAAAGLLEVVDVEAARPSARSRRASRCRTSADAAAVAGEGDAAEAVDTRRCVMGPARLARLPVAVADACRTSLWKYHSQGFAMRMKPWPASPKRACMRRRIVPEM